MNVASYFSGVGGLDLGLERAGLRVVSQCEADPWRRRVLAWHWPGVPITDDVRDESQGPGGRRDAGNGQLGESAGSERRIEPVVCDLVCGGVPCQDWSVAGKRAGIQGARSGLFFDWCDRIADFPVRPRWLLFENVPGLLSAANGRDFAVVLRTLADLGYGLAWRVLDARYFGVPQRRRRVFIVGHFGGEPGPAVLALGAGGEGDLEAGRCSWQGAAAGTGNGAQVAGVSFAQNQRGELRESDIAPQLMAGGGKPGEGYPAVRVPAPDTTGSCDSLAGDEAPFLQAEADAAEALRTLRSCVDPQAFQQWALGVLASLQAAEVLRPQVHGGGLRLSPDDARSVVGNGPPSRPQDVSAWAVRAMRHAAGGGRSSSERRLAGQYAGQLGTALSKLPHQDAPEAFVRALWEAAQGLGLLREALSAAQEVGRPPRRKAQPAHASAAGSVVRRLCPTETEALMSWPRNWTAVDGDRTPDGRRYAACGDGVVSNVSEWIGRRIVAVDREAES